MLHDNEMTRLPALDEAVMSGMLAIGVVGVIIDAALRRVQLTIETRRGL